METIELSVPFQDDNDQECTSLTISVLEAWLATLPQDIMQSGAAIKQFLDRINKTNLKKCDRYEALELFRPVIKRICTALTKQYIDANTPLDEQMQTLAALNIQLITALGTGYKIAAKDAYTKLKKYKEGEKNSQLVVNTFQRSINNLCWLLLETYRIYWPEPSGIWLDMNQIYLHAEQLNIHTALVEKCTDLETMLSIKQAYYRAVLLVVFNPYHLHKGEIASIFDRMQRWTNFVHVSKPGDISELEDNCYIDLDKDKSPKFMFDNDTSINLEHVRVISQKDLVQILTTQIEDTEKSKTASTAVKNQQLELYKRLLKALYPRQKRSSPRIPVSEKLTVANNLSTCYYFINGCKDFNPNIKIPNQDISKILDQPAPEQDHDEALTWNQKNQSESGVAIFCPQRCTMNAHVGEIVAFHNAIDEQTPWQVGVVRWIKTRPNGGMEFGIYVFANTSKAVEVKAVRGESSSFNFFRAILTPNVNPMREKASIFVPPDVYTEGTVILINLEDRVIHVILQEMIEKGHDFEHYSILPLHETSK
ncbi:MAG: hypothetical protein D6B28_10900 [Gammaproteobacteria bacterium]|nr:MAG: hypothetical protein D6B28_10900 [Gammaproteobacteria bacterium]